MGTEKLGLAEKAEIQEIYRADAKPWVIGYSGGKDSTAVLRLIFEALRELPQAQRTKPVFVVSSDTLVETPIVISLIGETLGRVQEAAASSELPLTVAQVTPKTAETFWVNLLGKGYPAPTRQFRWCTERMKIDPVSDFIRDKVARFGEVIVVLGSRVQESDTRAQVMKKHRIEGQRLSRHTTLVNAYVYTPIESWSADDVWEYLFSADAPWGGSHQALFDLYKGSNAGECPLVIDKSTPSCGNSRFGCWVCTVVTEDRAIDGLIQSGVTWLKPLKDFRNELYATTIPENKRRFRHERRRDGRVTVVINDAGEEKHIPGAYLMSVRQDFLRRLLRTQRQINQYAPLADYELITKEELEEIRTQWRCDPNEPDWADTLPRLYREELGRDLDWNKHDDARFDGEDSRLIAEAAREFGLPPELVMKLLEFEISMEGLSKRSQIYARLSAILQKDWGELEEQVRHKSQQGAQLRDREEQEKSLFERYGTLEKMLGNAS